MTLSDKRNHYRLKDNVYQRVAALGQYKLKTIYAKQIFTQGASIYIPIIWLLCVHVCVSDKTVNQNMYLVTVFSGCPKDETTLQASFSSHLHFVPGKYIMKIAEVEFWRQKEHVVNTGSISYEWVQMRRRHGHIGSKCTLTADTIDQHARTS